MKAVIKKGKHSRFIIDKDWLYDKYIKEKLSMNDIKKILNVSIATVHKNVHKYKFKPHPFCYKESQNDSDMWKNIGKQHKGKKLSKITKEKISNSHKGKKLNDEHKEKLRVAFSGKNNHQWRGGKKKYRGKEFSKNRIKTLIRDNYCCQMCFKYSKSNHVHHIIPYRISKDSGIFNLITLCPQHHKYMDIQYERGKK